MKMTINCLKETSTERRIVLNWPALIHCGSLLGTIHCPFSWESPFFWFSRSNQVIYVNYQLSVEAFDILRCESSSSSGNLAIFCPSLKKTTRSHLMNFSCWVIRRTSCSLCVSKQAPCVIFLWNCWTFKHSIKFDK